MRKGEKDREGEKERVMKESDRKSFFFSTTMIYNWVLHYKFSKKMKLLGTEKAKNWCREIFDSFWSLSERLLRDGVGHKAFSK